MPFNGLSPQAAAAATLLLALAATPAVGAHEPGATPEAVASANARLSLSPPAPADAPAAAEPAEPAGIPATTPMSAASTGTAESAGLGPRSAEPAPAAPSVAGSWLDPRRAGEAGRVGGALAVVCCLILGLRFLLRRAGAAGAGRPSGVVEILARYPVARGHHLVLLKLGRRILLLHQGSSGMSTLTDIADPEEVAGLLARVSAGSRGGARRAFASVLRRAAGQTQDGWPDPAGRLVRVESGATVVDLTRSRGRAALARRSVA
jgi:flagellar biogenesis protein FliO